jgi:hypothetical protein
MAVEEKSVVPTILVGVGGTGAEVLLRVRRLVAETYGSLEKFPVIGFLLIDTDKDYKVSNPEAAGTPLKDSEKFWAKVSGSTARGILENMERYPWINKWFPSELERNLTSLEAGAGQIRACGRFAFFCNYAEIEQKFRQVLSSVKGKENKMLDTHNIKVSTNGINVFITGSMSGGTGSGMLIDIGYAVRKWLTGEGNCLTTAIVPMPNAFAGVKVGDRVRANGYAALMELSYYSDYRTEYVENYSNNPSGEIRSKSAPYDFTYLVGTKNGETELKLDQVREMIAQNIFLDMTSDFSPHKRSIRDNMKGAWAQADPFGRGYPKQFMSFGLSTIEIPITQIRASLADRLTKDLVNWWLNESATLPPQMLELVRGELLKQMRLTESEMLADLAAANDRPYLEEIANWINGIRSEVSQENWLQCTQQGVNFVSAEKGKILGLVQHLKEKVDNYRAEHLREQGQDERNHGDFFKRMYGNRDELIKRGRVALEQEFYRIIRDRTRGPVFADSFIATARQVFTDATEKFRREQDKVWAPNENNRRTQYENALQEITEFKEKFAITKQADMERFFEEAMTGLQGSLTATIQRKARALGLQAIVRLQEHLDFLERRLSRLNQRLKQSRDFFDQRARQAADSADALQINGIKLYERQELNDLYRDLIEQLAGASEGSRTKYEIGLDQICGTLTDDVLKQASPLWQVDRTASAVMQLLDVTEIPDVQEDDLREILFDRSQQVIVNAPESTKLKKDLAACDLIYRTFRDESDIVNNVRFAYNKSKPLVMLNPGVMLNAGFTPPVNKIVGLLGGKNTDNPAAQKLLPIVREFIGSDDSIKPLGSAERHRIVFVQEIGGFSLRCLDGMRELRESYQDWKGESVTAKRARLRGENCDLPIPVHIQKEAPFWDIFPEDEKVFELVVQARSLHVLRQEQNRVSKEQAVRYTRQTSIGQETIDIAANWTEATQVLEVAACRDDREEIQRQLTQQMTALETDGQKQGMYQQLMGYLEQRAIDLDKVGGKESPEYRRESEVIRKLIETYKLKKPEVEGVPIPPVTPPFVPPQTPEMVMISQPTTSPEKTVNGTSIPPTSALSGAEKLAQLKELAQMKKDGLLTDEEFVSAKKLMGL